MAFAVVKWVDSNRYSVVPTTDIATSGQLVAQDLPMNALCKRGTERHSATIVRIGDSRLAMQVDLESMIALSNSVVVDMEEAMSSRNPNASSPGRGEMPIALGRAKRPATELEPKATPTTKRKCTAADRVSRKTHRSSLGSALPVESSAQSCTKCKEYELQLQTLEAKLAICQSDLEDACLAKAAKFAVIQDLRAQLRETQSELERKTALLEETVEKNVSLALSSRETLTLGTCPLPVPPPQGVEFLRSLVDFYVMQHRGHDDENERGVEDESIQDSDDARAKFENANAVFQERVQPRCLGEGSMNAPELLPLTSLSPNEGRSTYLPNGDFQLVNVCDELDSSVAVYESPGYSYKLTPEDITREQSAFEPGPDKQELVRDCGVYISGSDLKRLEFSTKDTSTGLMRSLITIWYSSQRLAASSATRGINEKIRMAIFKYCQEKFPGVTLSKLKRDLTNKCGEERRAILKYPVTLS